MIVVWWMMHTLQLDEELALRTVHESKRALNHAAHAAAQQLDGDKLEMGILSIDQETAAFAALQYLQENLRLNDELMPLGDSLLKDRVAVHVFDVMDEDISYPYLYRNEHFGYETVFRRPGVVLIIELNYARVFGMIHPIKWVLKGAAELVY